MKKKNPFKLNNRGVSLTELIVVIAIMAVLTGTGIAMAGMLPRMQVNGCTEDFVGNMNKVKTGAMSFKEVWVDLYQDDTGVYMQTRKDGVTEDAVQIGEKGVSCRVLLNDGMLYELSAGTKISFSYDRSSGGFKYVQVNGSDAGEHCKTVVFYRGTLEREISFITLTGRLTY